MSQASDIFTQHHAEIRRRADLVHEGGVNPGVFERADGDGPQFEFVQPDQSWVLFSVSHARMCPLALDPRNPAVRIYGAFDTREAAVAHSA